MVIPRLTHCGQQANRPHRVARMRRRQGTVLNRFSPRRKLYQISCPLGCLILTPHEPISIPNWKLATLELATLPHWQHFRPRSVGRAHTLARPSGCLRQCSLRGFASSVHVLGEPPPGPHKSNNLATSSHDHRSHPLRGTSLIRICDVPRIRLAMASREEIITCV